jgi:hypothetical protein
MKRVRPIIALLAAILLLGGARAGATQGGMPGGDALWFNPPEQGAPRVTLHVFWSKRCPHCLEARPFVASLQARYPWLDVASYELNDNPENRSRFVEMATLLGQQPRSVPTFMLCARMYVGWGGEQHGGPFLEQKLLDCYASVYGASAPGSTQALAAQSAASPLEIPLFGGLQAADLSLPVLTLVLAGMDAFNPCAFFVLLFLLSMLVHTRSRRVMLLVGGVFVTISGLVYFAFMAAWLNLFLVFGELQVVTLGAGVVAVLIGLINIKDYFWFREGVSLTLSDGQKRGLSGRSRALLGAGSMPALLASTVLLALVANMYELLCTAGFPMVYTRVLTLNELPAAGHYLYLLLYNVVYVIPLLLIVVLFAVTLGSRKLRESEGRFLKLLSGLMMLALGVLLVVAPQHLNSPGTAALLLAGALAAAWLIAALTHRYVSRPRDT